MRLILLTAHDAYSTGRRPARDAVASRLILVALPRAEGRLRAGTVRRTLRHTESRAQLPSKQYDICRPLRTPKVTYQQISPEVMPNTLAAGEARCYTGPAVVQRK
jgi:hypothetical protein